MATSLGGDTVLLTTHDMADVEQLCSRVLIIDHGTLLYDGTLDGIRDRLSTERTLVVDLASDGPGRVDVPGATEVRADGPRRWLQFNRLRPRQPGSRHSLPPAPHRRRHPPSPHHPPLELRHHGQL